MILSAAIILVAVAAVLLWPRKWVIAEPPETMSETWQKDNIYRTGTTGE